MPSHQERVAKNYAGRCVECLTLRKITPNQSWDDENDRSDLCSHCRWYKHFQDARNLPIPLHMWEYLIPTKEWLRLKQMEKDGLFVFWNPPRGPTGRTVEIVARELERIIPKIKDIFERDDIFLQELKRRR